MSSRLAPPTSPNGHARPASPAAGERQPLLRGRRSSVLSTTSEGHEEGVPITQLVLICIWRATNPLFSEVILPYIAPLLVEQLHVADERTVGYKSGTIQSIVAVTICVGIFPGAWLSDAIGRKPTILAALFCGAAAQTFFAFASSYRQLVLARMLVGLCCSIIPANVKTFSIELSTEATVPIFYAVMSLGWQGGSMTAPLLGGLLAKPVELFPSLKGTIFDTFPYALPSLVTAIIPAIAGVLGIFLAQETLPKEKRKGLARLVSRTKRLPQRAEKAKTMFTRGVVYIMFIWVLMILLICAFNAVQVLFFYSPRAEGGMGLTPRQMSFFFMLRPLLLVVYEVTVYPVMAKRFGPERILGLTSYLYVASYGIFFGLSYAVSTGLDQAWLFAGLILTIVINVGANPMFIAADQVIGIRAPTQAHIARLNAFSELAANLAGGLGLFSGGWFYAFSQQYNLLGGRAAWLVLFILAIVQCIACQFVTKVPGWREERTRGERRFNPQNLRRMSTVSMYIGS